MNILDQEQRSALLRSLEHAPDEILLDAVRQTKEWRKSIVHDFDELRAYIGMRVQETKVPPPVKPVSVPAPDACIINKRPPGVAAKALRNATLEGIGAALAKEPRDIHYMANALRMAKGHCEGILLAAWERGVVEFDGKLYRRAS